MKYQTISLFAAKGSIYYVTIAMVIFSCVKMLFSRVKISCFGANAHLVFHWCLYNKKYYFVMLIIMIINLISIIILNRLIKKISIAKYIYKVKNDKMKSLT